MNVEGLHEELAESAAPVVPCSSSRSRETVRKGNTASSANARAFGGGHCGVESRCLRNMVREDSVFE